MKLSSVITDNITEVLFKIVEFTQVRQKILIQNVNCIEDAGYVPLDLAVDEFSGIVSHAISEHVERGRLVLYDSESVKFGADGTMELRRIPDRLARELLLESRDEYLELQVNKLLENALNQKVAVCLLRQKNEKKLGY